MNNDITKTILLVEDEAIISIITARALKKFGYDVISVNSGEKAVKLAVSDNSINLALMDIDLGEGMDGTEAARRILTVRNIPIVFQTSHSEREMVEKVKGITRYGYVIKSSGDFVLNSSIEMAFELFEANRNIENTMLAMKESEEKYRAAFMTSPDAVNINGMDGMYVDINDGFTKLTGYTRDDVIGVLSSEIDIWSRPEDRVKLIKGLTESGSVENLESLFRCKDGSTKTALMSARIIKLKNEPHILSITRDISERKEFERKINTKNEELSALNGELIAAMEELEAANEEFEAMNEELTAANRDLQSKEQAVRDEQFFTNSLIDSLPGIFYLYSYPGLQLKRWNKNHETILGFDPSEIKDRSLFDWHIPEAKDAVAGAVKQVMDKGYATMESLLRGKDGALIPFLLTGVRFEAEGKLYLMGVGIDVTERRKIEDALCESEERYRNLARILPDGVVIHSDGKIVYANEAAHKIIHAEYPGQLIGFNVMDFVHPDYLELVSKRINNGVSKQLRGEPVEEIFKTLDGNSITVSVTAIPFTYSGKPAMLTVFNDITERKCDEEKIKNLLEEKELLLKEVHHRIKNNMYTINSLLTLQAETMKDSSAIAALEDAQSRVQSMLVLYDKLYRSDDFRDLSLKEYLPSLIDEISANFIMIEQVKIEKHIQDFNVDAKTLFPLGIIVNEIITNAMKYAFTGRDRGLIAVFASMNDNHVVISIADDGNGIPETVDIEHSTGFGLSLISMLTQQIGGSVRIERMNGTKFIIEFDV
ncbi:MAG TPA: PAS domain S-box protein [Spirochaetota bacterium]|nr:PAS domain S-box protein [Spirochaetota bacterium]